MAQAVAPFVKEKARRLFEVQDIEVTTKSVEKMLSPLIKQVTTLQDNISGRTRSKKLKNVFKLIQIVDKATDNFTSVAENIAADNPEFQDELWLAIEDVRTGGNLLHEAAQEYTTEVMVPRKREAMEGRAGDLLKSVTRLLVLIDLIDINELFKASNRIDAKLQNLKQVKTWETFVESMKAVAKDIRDVSETAIARQKELKNSTAKQLLVAAHAELSQQSKMLITSTKTFLNHPDDESAIENRDYTINRLSEVLQTIARLADGENPEDIQKDIYNSDNEEDVPPENHPMPESPIHPPSSHIYPIEFYSSLPNGTSSPPPTLDTSQQSSEDDHSIDSSVTNKRKPHRHLHRTSGEFDHLHSKRESGQFDHLNSQDTYSSSSSFSAYHPEDIDESAIDISKKAAQNLPGLSDSKIYQVSSGTLPVMQVNSSKTQVSHANHASGGVAGASANKPGSEFLQVKGGGGHSSLISYPRGHAHLTKVSSMSTTATSQTQGKISNMTVPHHGSGSTHHQVYPRDHEHSALSSSVLSHTSGQHARVSTITASTHKQPPNVSSYPRGHTHFKNMPQSSPIKANAGGFGAAHIAVTSPPKRLQKSIENFETILEQTAKAPDPPPVEAKEQLQAGFDNILNATSIIADFESTRDQHGLLAQCDVVRQKLQSLLKVIVTDKDKKDQNISEETAESVCSDDNSSIASDIRGEGDGVEEKEAVLRRSNYSSSSVSSRAIRRSVQLVEEETATLRAELRKAMIDHVSDTFVDPCVPLTRMVAAAKQGNKPSVDQCADQFLTHAEKIVHVSNLVCSLTNDGPANREVRLAAKPIESLKHQVVSAAKTLAGHPTSESALKNMTAFQDLWIEKLKALTDAVDKVIPLHDFIAVTEAHIREDSRRLIEAIEVSNFAMSVGCANVIQGRYDRLVQMVELDMMNHEARYAPEHATALKNVMDKMASKVFPEFQSMVHTLCNKQGRLYDSDIRNLEDHLQNINDGIRDMRIYILRTRTKEELKAEPDVDDILSPSSSGLLSPSASFEFMDEEMFNGGQAVNIPSPVFNRASQHGQNTPPRIEVDIEEMEVTGQQYQSMLSYPSMNILEEIKEEDEEDTSEEESNMEEAKEMERQQQLEKEKIEKEKEEEEERKRAEQEKEEAVRRKNEELLNKNFKQRKSRMRKASSEKRLQEDRPNIEDEDYMTVTGTMRRRLIKRTPSVAVINETETAKAVLAQLSVQQQEEIAKEQERLEQEHKVFEKEVNQWDDTSNDIIVLAKEMCWMVMDMSDFLSGEGQLLTTMDVINTAKDVTNAAKNLISLAQQVADLCPEGSSRNDLLAYLDRIKLFCNQLKISSAVLTDLENVKGSADNLNNLLISAKSLMNTVVMVVKGCYVASKAIKRIGGKLPIELLQWRMMKPKKKHLYSREFLAASGELTKESNKYTEKSAILELGAFRGRHSVVDNNEDTIARLTKEQEQRNMKRHRF